MYFDTTVYPDNYNWIPEKIQNEICEKLTAYRNRWMELRQELSQARMTEAPNCSTIQNLERDAHARLCGMLSMCHYMEIYPEIGWYGHRREYFLATYDDAEGEYEWLLSLREDG